MGSQVARGGRLSLVLSFHMRSFFCLRLGFRLGFSFSFCLRLGFGLSFSFSFSFRFSCSLGLILSPILSLSLGLALGIRQLVATPLSIPEHRRAAAALVLVAR